MARESFHKARLLFFRTSQRCQKGIFSLLTGRAASAPIPSLHPRLPCFLFIWSRATEPHMGSGCVPSARGGSAGAFPPAVCRAGPGLPQ